MPAVSMTVNGKAVSADVDARTLLVQFLRENLRLTGTHVGCDTSQCGACVVHLDGKAVKSCTTLALQCEGANVLTIEGLAAPDGPLHPMQEAFRENHGLQCGFCTPGMVMAAVDMVNRKGNELDEHTIRQELDGNLCRCTGYHNIVKAIAAGAKAMKGEAPRKLRVDSYAASEGGDRHDARPGSAPRCVARKTSASSPARASTPTTSAVRARPAPVFVRSPHAHAKIKRIDTKAAAAMPGVLAVLTGAELAERQDRQPDLRLDDPFQGRLADEDGAASGARRRQGLLCRRSGRGGGRRDAGAGQGRGREGQGRLRGAAGGDRSRQGAERPADPRGRAEQHDLSVAPRRRQGGRCRVQGGEARHQARHRQQPAGAQRDGAARRDRRIRSRQRQLHALEHLARTRTSRGSSSPPSSAWRPSTSCA